MGAGWAVLCTLVCTASQAAAMSCAREAGRLGRVVTCSVRALGCVACATGQVYKGSMYLMCTRVRRANKGASGGVARTAKETTCSPLQSASHGALIITPCKSWQLMINVQRVGQEINRKAIRFLQSG